MNRLTLATFAERKVHTLILAVSLTAAVVAGGTDKPGNASGSNPQRASSEGSHNMKISIKIGDKILTATLVDDQTARDFVSLLPLNLSMDDLFGREKYGNLPKALSEKGPRTHSYKVGDIAYWSPAHDVAIY